MDTKAPITEYNNSVTRMEPGPELDLMVEAALGNCPLETFCSGEKEFTGDGRWYCLKCGFSVEIPGDTNFIHAQRPKPYSTDWRAAGEAFEWLEKNNPWLRMVMGLSQGYGGEKKPAVMVLRLEQNHHQNFFYSHPSVAAYLEIEGQTYPHAIALAVVEVARLKGGERQ